MRLYAVVLTAFAAALIVEGGKNPPHQSDAARIAGNVERTSKRSNFVRSTLSVRSHDTCTCDDVSGTTVVDTNTTTTDTNTTNTNTTNNNITNTTTTATVGTPDIEFFFDQLIDHTNPTLGTFKQRYWFSAQLWGGQGYPIILSNPGEQSAEGFNVDLTGYSMMNALMTELSAAGVVLERRSYYIPISAIR